MYYNFMEKTERFKTDDPVRDAINLNKCNETLSG
jgi:hypothetical protein